MTDEDRKLDKELQREFFKRPPERKRYYVSAYWEKQAEKERNEPSVWKSLGIELEEED